MPYDDPDRGMKFLGVIILITVVAVVVTMTIRVFMGLE